MTDKTKSIPPLVAEFGRDTVGNVAREHLYETESNKATCRVCGKEFPRTTRGGSGYPHFAMASHAKMHGRANEALDIYVDDQANASGWQGYRIMPERADVEKHVADRKAARDREPQIKQLKERVKPIEIELRNLESERYTAENAVIQMIRQDRADVPEFAQRCKDIRNAGKQIKALVAKRAEIAGEYSNDVVDAARITV